MPSRKKAQGKARKAAKADKAKEAASLPPKPENVSEIEITLDSWLTLTCCDDDDNDDESERCHHGCDLSMPKSEHDCRDFAMRFASDYLSEMCRVLTSRESERILKQASKSEDFAGTCLKESKSFIAALQDMVDKYADVFENPSKIMWAISYCSVDCQKVNWKYHKQQCACLAKMNSFDENVFQGN